ncbi:MAG: ABC transporter permease [Deferribacteres bacterium]|nr:ABC transporter permease [candidate division KSB1 bacterium]MCB9511648.1 ABC transporter permease [Deferribacteres bacterium]
MGFEYFVAKKYLRSKQKTTFVKLSLITYISTIGVMIGVAALIIALSVANGFEHEVRSRIIGFDAHVKLRTYHDRGISDYERVVQRMDSLKSVVGAGPYLSGKGMIASGAGGKEFVKIKAIDPERESKVTNLINNVIYGSLDLGMIKPKEDDKSDREYPGILIGKWLADRLQASVGDRVQVLSAAGIDLGAFSSLPRMRTYRVAGWFETGLYEYDDIYAFISIEEGQKLFEMPGKVTGIQIKLDDLEKATEFSARLNDQLGYPYWSITWFDLNKNLFSWMELEKIMIFLVLSLIILVAAFNIVGTLIMVVMEKRRDIGILKSMGAMASSVMKIFVYQGLFAGLIGAALGLVLGYVFGWSQMKYEWLSIPGDVYIVSALPMRMESIDFVMIATAAVLLCFSATVYPAYKASKLDPIEAIRDQ